MATTPDYAPDPIFAPLTATQLRNLMRRIRQAIDDTSMVCTVLYNVVSSKYPDLDIRYDNLHRDLCHLHSDLFRTAMAKADESED